LDPKFLASTINKFLHLAAAGVVVGSLVYLRFILLPALDKVEEAQRAAVWQAAFRKSLRWVSYSLALLILTGLDNIMKARKTLGALTPEQVSGYWGAFWAKIVCVVLAFVFVHMLLVRVPAFERFRAAHRGWLAVLVVLALLILYLSGYLTLTRLSVLTPFEPRSA
jgi:uncharacterized membrane protein